jgi:hypothetical protein
MKIISLGSTCQVKYNIDRLFKQEETNFFDWVIVDFKSILYILKNINDKDLISKSKFTDKEIFKPGKSWVKSHHKIECIDFKMISLHDIPSTVNYLKGMNAFVTKYIRRLDRFKNLIISNEIIHMIHCLDHQFTEGYIITNDDICNFNKYLSDINPNNNCFLHIVIPPKYSNIDLNNLMKDKVYIYYLEDTKRANSDWKNINFNWNIIFDNIKNL